MMNNINNNNIYIAAFYEHFLPGINLKTHYLRCLNYIINLIAKFFLYDINPEAFKSEAVTLNFKKINDKYHKELFIL